MFALARGSAARPHLVARIAGAVAAFVGSVVLVGWAAEVDALKGFGQDLAMKPNTAISFVLGGASVWLLSEEGIPRLRHVAGKVFAAATGLIGLLTAVEYASGRDLGIDQLLFKDLATLEGTPGRMAVTSAISFILLGSALMILDVETRGGGRPAQPVALLASLPPFFGLAGYLYGAGAFLTPTTEMSLHAVGTFFVLCAGVLAARPDRGVMRLVTEQGPASVMVRRLLPGSVAVLFLFGWLRVRGQEAGLYSAEFGVVLHTTTTLAVIMGAVWLVARGLSRTDAEYRDLQKALIGGERSLKLAISESSLDAVISMDHQGRVIEWNPSAERTFGFRRDEVIGKEIAELIIPPELRMRHRQGLSHYLATGEGPVIGQRLELTALRRDGNEFPVELSVTQVESTDPPIFIGFVRDITTRREQESALRRYAFRLEGLRAIDRAILFAASLEELVNDTLLHVEKLIDCERADVSLYDFEAETVTVFRSTSAPPFPGGTVIPLATVRETVGDIFSELREGRAKVFDDVRDLPAESPLVRDVREEGILSVLTTPIIASDDLIGALTFMHRQPAAFQPEDVQIAREVADQLAVAILQIRLYERVEGHAAELEGRVAERTAELERMTLVDDLTGLSNRRALSAFGERELKIAARTGRPATLLFVDLDGLKGINDSWGHEAGDQALKDLASLFMSALREADLVVRLGGDEFCVLVSEGAPAAQKVLERLEDAVRRHNETAGRPYTLSFTAGVARFDPANPSTLEEMVRQADRDMYELKRQTT